MFAKSLRCRNCNTEYMLENLYHCEKCGGILEVTYSEEMLNPDRIEHPDDSLPGMWRYSSFLPVKNKDNIVSLGEGNTPLLKADRIAESWGKNINLYIKGESLNPTGSFKDRPTSVAVSVAKEQGAEKIVVASSGNASAAAAAYAARAGIGCVVFIPENTDKNKVIQAQSYGAQVVRVKGDYSKSFHMAMESTKEYGWVNVTSTFLNPYTVEGDKMPAYELYHQLNGQVPDYILIPIGSGPLLVGMYKGFEELKAMGLITSLPKMIGVQASECAPITKAFEEKQAEVSHWDKPINTIAGGISDPLTGYEQDGTLTLDTVIASGGVMTALTEEEIAKSTAIIENKIGLYSEPTGAVSVGAVKKLMDSGVIEEGATAVSFLTGHGFKFSGRDVPLPPVIESLSQFAKL